MASAVDPTGEQEKARLHTSWTSKPSRIGNGIAIAVGVAYVALIVSGHDSASYTLLPALIVAALARDLVFPEKMSTRTCGNCAQVLTEEDLTIPVAQIRPTCPWCCATLFLPNESLR